MESPEELWGNLKWQAVQATCFKVNPKLHWTECPGNLAPALVCVVYSYREVFPEAYEIGVLEYDGGDTHSGAWPDEEFQAECWAPSDDIHQERLIVPFRALRPANDAEISAYLMRLEGALE